MNTEERVRQMMDQARGEEEVTGAEWESFSTRAHRSLRMQRMVAAGVAIVLIAAASIGTATLFDEGRDGELVTPVGPTDARGDTYTRPVELWHFERSPVPELTQALVQVEVEPGRELHAVVETLLSKPYEERSKERNFVTSISPTTRLLSARIEHGTAIVDLSKDFETFEGGKGVTQARQDERIAQVVLTATQLQEVSDVQIFVEGRAIAPPLTRDDLPETAPPIIVDEPKIGTSTNQFIVVKGSANVFEGTVSIAITHRENGELYETTDFTTATCGSGCRGKFSKVVAFPHVDKPTEAVVHVYEESAEDGSRLHQVKIPITVMPMELPRSSEQPSR